MKKPNFFIVGAPKCGTTALSEYLREHPYVFLTKRKELNYFNTDFSNAFRIRYGAQKLLKKDDDYLDQFKEVKNEHKAIGEGTVWYMYSHEAIKRIWLFNKNAKLIIMLRNPTDMVFSLHNQMIYSFNDDVEAFETAWNLQEERKRGESIPQTCLEPKLLQYQDICMLGSQLERIYSIFPKDQVMPILFEDFVIRTREIYEDVLEFLGLESDGRLDFPRINVYKTHRLSFINYWMLGRPPFWLVRIVDTIKRRLKIESLGGVPLLMKYNVIKDERKPLDPSIHRKIINVFSRDIDLLELLIDRDLSHWKEYHD